MERYVFWRRSCGRAWLQRQPESRFAAHGHAAGQSPAKNNSVRVEIEMDPEIAEASEVLQGLSEDF